MNTTSNKPNPPILEEDDIFKLLRKLIAQRTLIIRNVVIGLCVGVAFALGVQKTWTTEVVLAPEVTGENSLGGSLSSMASLVGINVGAMTTDAIYPELYPDIISATPFITDLFDVHVESLDGEISTTLYDYLDKHQKSSWWGYPILWARLGVKKIKDLISPDKFNKNGGEVDPFYLSKRQDEIYRVLSDAVISSNVNKKDQIITLTVTTQDPLISATLADTVRVRLQAAITDYRTHKARHDMKYAENLMNEARAEYVKCQQKYADFSDSHVNTVLKSVSSEQDDLENQMLLAYNVYSQTVQQYTLAKAKVQERTPSFTIIKPSSVSLKPSSTPKLMVAFLWTFMFLVLTVVWILCIDTLKSWRTKLFTK